MTSVPSADWDQLGNLTSLYRLLDTQGQKLLHGAVKAMPILASEVIKLFSCSTQPSTKFPLLIKTKILIKKFLALSFSEVVFIMLLNVKMPKCFELLRSCIFHAIKC